MLCLMTSNVPRGKWDDVHLNKGWDLLYELRTFRSEYEYKIEKRVRVLFSNLKSVTSLELS